MAIQYETIIKTYGEMKKQVVLYCNYTNENIRSHLKISNLKLDNLLRKKLGIPILKYRDAAPWIKSFISYFEKSAIYELHIACIQQGLISDFEMFNKNGVYYHYIKSGYDLLTKVQDKLFKTQKSNDYPIYRNRFSQALATVKPDLVIICGAENPDYAADFLKNKCANKLVVMQTLMNDPKRIAMGVSTEYRCHFENRVLREGRHFAIPDPSWTSYVRSVNKTANCYDFIFPTQRPPLSDCSNASHDFVFFAGILGTYKGTNDLVDAMAVIHKVRPKATLNIIGGADTAYMDNLKLQISRNHLDEVVTLTPSFANRSDVFKEVAKASYVVLPSITASLNSTVREAMLMGLPTIVYETSSTKKINEESCCLLSAKMEDVDDLANKMLYALDNPSAMAIIGKEGKIYAENHFTQEAFEENLSSIIDRIMNAYEYK